jgi:hypothetical protein
MKSFYLKNYFSNKKNYVFARKKNKGGFWIRKYIFLLLFKSFNFLLMLILIVLGFFFIKKTCYLKKISS